MSESPFSCDPDPAENLDAREDCACGHDRSDHHLGWGPCTKAYPVCLCADFRDPRGGASERTLDLHEIARHLPPKAAHACAALCRGDEIRLPDGRRFRLT